ncbi:hypothetical protein Glove_332g51 [Diversispora epigaea]|uniref:F-box domain-containing protein n=1 Tax=Diversispora epigaea TaxID=1348612 RepID=A0A397HRL5_9GLOM|nr:hypothetical protein Glove_332g51 [Diversispora epigaea]
MGIGSHLKEPPPGACGSSSILVFLRLGSYPSSLVLEPKKAEDITPPIQLDQSVDNYFKMIKVYATVLSVDLDNQDFKETFFNEAIRFGIKKPIKEIVERIKKINIRFTDMQKFRFGCLERGKDSVMEYYAKIKKYNKTVGYEEEQLRHQFLRGLNSDNQLEAEICGLKFPLEELVERLSAIENIRKMHKLLEQILYFLEIDRSLYPALFVNHLWYHCSASILWRRVKFFNEDYQQSQHALNMSRVLTHKGFSNIPIIEIARYCPKLLHLSLNSCICLTNQCITKITRFCPKLRYLELDDCLISNKTVNEITGNCINLKYLSLKECIRISNEVIKKLNPKIKIEYPDYSDDEFSDSDLSPLIPDPLRNEIVLTNTLNITDLISAIRVSSELTDPERINLLNSLAQAIGQ